MSWEWVYLASKRTWNYIMIYSLINMSSIHEYIQK
jgi:hypothetical protein